jgi:UDP-glucuronate 4-epimerase
VPRTYADISKARRLLGYDPRTSFEEGMKHFVAWYRWEVLGEQGASK